MKRLLVVCLFIVCLSFPALGGHTVSGGRYCECNSPQSCVYGLSTRDREPLQGNKDHQNSAPNAGLILLVLAALMLRYKA